MKIGTGALLWTEAQVLDTSMSVIEDAYSCRVDMILYATGRGALPTPGSSNTSLTPALFDVLFEGRR